MTVTKEMKETKHIKIKGDEFPYYKIDFNANGNPRYVIHFLELGIELKDYGKIPGLTKYRAKWFGGGYVFQSYNLEQDILHALNIVKTFYNK